MLADVSAIIGSLDIVFGEIDRWPSSFAAGYLHHGLGCWNCATSAAASGARWPGPLRCCTAGVSRAHASGEYGRTSADRWGR